MLPETARCCSDHAFYNILLTFPGLGVAPGDRLMLLRPCILQYIIDFPGSRRSSGDRSMLLRPCILQYIINFPGSRRSSGDRSMLLRPGPESEPWSFSVHAGYTRMLGMVGGGWCGSQAMVCDWREKRLDHLCGQMFKINAAQSACKNTWSFFWLVHAACARH